MIFLTSSVATVADHLYSNYLRDKNFKTVLLIDTAAEPELTGKKEKDIYLDGRIQKAYRDDEPPFLLINDHQYIVISDDGSHNIVSTI